MLGDFVTSGAIHSIKCMFQKKKERNIIIDPFSCLVKLSIIRFLDEGTKISIYQNRLNFNAPTYAQGLIRFVYGDNREDLHNILLPIQKCVEWYWNDKNEDITYMFKNAVLGLKFLKNSYSAFATIQHTLDYYIIILMQRNTASNNNIYTSSQFTTASNNYITTGDSKQEQPKSQKEKPDTKLDTKLEKIEKIDKIDNSTLQMKDIHKFLFELWNQREMNIVINLYKEMVNKQPEQGIDRDYIYKNIMQYCEMKENKLYTYIEENSSIL